MAGGIKGITVEIGGDTTKLGKALSEVNSKSKGLSKELKGVNTLLKLDPGNVTLLKQKEDLLNKSVTETKTKLDALKQAMNQIDSG
jgi:phage-related minor tail protein